MKDTRDWDEDYLLNLPAGEYDWFEAKGRQALDLTLSNVNENVVRGTLSKAVSALANSGGGVLAYGITKANNRWQIDDGGVSLKVKTPDTKEWLEDIIPVVVEPQLRKFNVYTIEGRLHNSLIGHDRAVYLIDIQDSEQAPHQANDKCYYGRIGGKSVPLSHRFIADMFGRRKDPQIELDFKIEVASYYERDYGYTALPMYPFGTSKPEKPKRKRKRKVTLRIRATNSGRVYAQYVNCHLYIPESLGSEFDRQYSRPVEVKWASGSFFTEYKDNTHRDLIKADVFGPGEYGPSRYSPILPTSSEVWSRKLLSTLTASELQNSEYQIHWRVYADNAPMRSGSIPVREIRFVDKTNEIEAEDDDS